ncbi:MAG: nucleotidyltransferase domain-containing protein [Elusimicrobia bacterium]|nr:nucleotidyltransferase domain-containing protein [Elusimicrobiota bacterium]
MENNPGFFLGLHKSRARRSLFALFFTNPEAEYFPRQLERVTGVLVGNLQRELVRMEAAGLLSSRRLGKLKLYKLNVEHPLYPELKGLVAKTVGLEEAIRGWLSGVDGVEAVCIYGSFARNRERADSDLDLLVIGDVDEKPLIQSVKELEKQLQREVNYTLYSRQDWIKRRHGRDSFVAEVLKSPRIRIMGDIDGIR